jgi:hypothetical protein
LSAGLEMDPFPERGEARSPNRAQAQANGDGKGWPDFILIHKDGSTHFLELKRAGGSLTPEQRDFRDWCRSCGIPHVVSRSLHEALEALAGWGRRQCPVGLEGRALRATTTPASLGAGHGRASYSKSTDTLPAAGTTSNPWPKTKFTPTIPVAGAAAVTIKLAATLPLVLLASYSETGPVTIEMVKQNPGPLFTTVAAVMFRTDFRGGCCRSVPESPSHARPLTIAQTCCWVTPPVAAVAIKARTSVKLAGAPAKRAVTTVVRSRR